MKGFYIHFVCTQFTEICQVILRHCFVRSTFINTFEIWIWRHASLMSMKYTSSQNEKKWKRKDIFVHTNERSLVESFVYVWAIDIFHRLLLEIKIVLFSYQAVDEFFSPLIVKLVLRSNQNIYLHELLENLVVENVEKNILWNSWNCGNRTSMAVMWWTFKMKYIEYEHNLLNY